MPRPEIPAPYQELANVLGSSGFAFIDDLYDSTHFGDRMLEFAGSDICIRLIKDRGQWSVTISGPGCTWWFSTTTWRDYLDGIPGHSIEELGIDDECRFLMERLHDVKAAVLTDPALLDNLKRFSKIRLAAKAARIKRNRDL